MITLITIAMFCYIAFTFYIANVLSDLGTSANNQACIYIAVVSLMTILPITLYLDFGDFLWLNL